MCGDHEAILQCDTSQNVVGCEKHLLRRGWSLVILRCKKALARPMPMLQCFSVRAG